MDFKIPGQDWQDLFPIALGLRIRLDAMSEVSVKIILVDASKLSKQGVVSGVSGQLGNFGQGPD